MKKTIHIIVSAAVAIAALTSCAKEEFKENVIPAGEPIEVSLNGQIGEFTPADATKATAESVVRVTWGAGDKVYVYDGGNASIGTLTVTPDDNNASYAMLSGTITASSASPSKLTLVYVKGATAAPDIAGGKISVDLSNQDEAEVPFVLYTTVDYDADALTKTNEYISFSFATSVMTVNCTGLQTGASGAVEGIDRAEIDGVSTRCELTIDGSGVTAVAGTTPGKITRTETAEPSVFTQSDSRGAFRLALAADPTAPAERNILVHQGSKVSGASFTTATLAGGKSYNTVYQMGEYVSIMLPGEFTVNASGKKVHFSKGNLWADATDSNNPVFHFEEHQYDYPVTNNSAHKSYFRWSIDAKNDFSDLSFDGFLGMVTEPYMEELLPLIQDEDFDALFEALNEIYKEGLFTNNPNFQVGNAPAGTYSTLTNDEWKYLFSENDIRRGRYKCGVTVCGKTNCVVLLPDNWDSDIISLTDFANKSEYNGESNPTWEEMEGAGAVCLPAAGRIIDGYEEEIFVINECGFYWTSSSFFNLDWTSARCVYFNSEEVIFDIEPDNCDIRNWQSIRLVTESGGYAPAVKVTGVSLNKTKTTIEAGATERLVATIAPADATNKQVNWSSSDEAVATVDQNGKVTGVAVGSAVITVATADGNLDAVCLVTVTPVPVSNVSLDKTKLTLYVGSSDVKLTATVNPQNADNKTVSWSSDKTDVAIVYDQGYVHAVAPGTATITVTTDDGGKTATCTVTVKPALLAGALAGEFTVGKGADGQAGTADDVKVYFSKGNLWYGKVGDAQTATFNFEANQYDYQSTWTDSHVSHFYWSKDASVAYAQSYSDANANVNDIFFTNDPTDSKKAKPDFTVNGVAGKYRTLSEDEWYYLLNKDTYANDIRKDKCRYNVTVCEKKTCTVLLPDNWDTSVISLSNFKTTTKYDETTTPKWSEMEAAGAVCLPAAGSRLNDNFYSGGEKGNYSSTNRSTDVSQGARAKILVITSSGGAFSDLVVSNAFSVRLVTDAE